jgi:hypothetical protein
MPAEKLRSSLLLRASAALVLMLVLWWLVLSGPLLFLLRHSAGFAMSVLHGGDSGQFISVSASGDWNFHVPLELGAQYVPAEHRTLEIHSIDFTAAPRDLNAFTFSVPVLWALLLAAPGFRRCLRPLLLGTLLMGGVELVSFLLFVDLAGYRAVAQNLQPLDGFATWWMGLGDYLLRGVVPFVAPFFVAIALHRDLRTEVLSWAAGTPLAQPAARETSASANENRLRKSRQRRTPRGA